MVSIGRAPDESRTIAFGAAVPIPVLSQVCDELLLGLFQAFVKEANDFFFGLPPGRKPTERSHGHLLHVHPVGYFQVRTRTRKPAGQTPEAIGGLAVQVRLRTP